MKSRKLLSCSLLLISGGLIAQSINLRKVVVLPDKVAETSGITTTNPLYIWTHNDGGNSPALYKVDTFGTVLKTLTIKNTANIDWEDITRDDQDNFYIGDFGNNENKRKDLKIYKLPNIDEITGDSASAEVISFSYPNQHLFPPDAPNRIFDTEAFLHFNGFLYIFTKNRTDPFTGFTYLYKVPSIPGNYTATLLDSFKTGDGIKEMWWISSACISPDHKKVAILSSEKMFVFTEFSGDSFFKGKVKQIGLNSFTQKEAIVFYNNDDFYITDEKYPILDGMNLYQGSVKSLYTIGVKNIKKKTESLVDCKKTSTGYNLSLVDENKNVTVSLIDMGGKIIHTYMLNKYQPSCLVEGKPGYYALQIDDGILRQELQILIR